MSRIPIPFIGGGAPFPSGGDGEDQLAPPYHAGMEAAEEGAEAESGGTPAELGFLDEAPEVAGPPAETEGVVEEAPIVPEEPTTEEVVSPPTEPSDEAAEPEPVAIEALGSADAEEGEEAFEPAAQVEPAGVPEPEEPAAEIEEGEGPPGPDLAEPAETDETSTAEVADDYTPLEAAADEWGEDIGAGEVGAPEEPVASEMPAAVGPEAIPLSEGPRDVDEPAGAEVPAGTETREAESPELVDADEPETAEPLAAETKGTSEAVAAEPDFLSPEPEEEGVHIPDFLFGADEEQEEEPEAEGREPVSAEPRGAAGPAATEPPAGLEEELAYLLSELLTGERGREIRNLIEELRSETAEQAIPRAFAAGYVAGRRRRED